MTDRATLSPGELVMVRDEERFRGISLWVSPNPDESSAKVCNLYFGVLGLIVATMYNTRYAGRCWVMVVVDGTYGWSLASPWRRLDVS